MDSNRAILATKQDPDTHEVTDFTSFYALNSTVIGHERHNTLNAAYAFYTVSTKTPLKQLMNDALIMAKQVCVCVRVRAGISHTSVQRRPVDGACFCCERTKKGSAC